MKGAEEKQKLSHLYIQSSAHPTHSPLDKRAPWFVDFFAISVVKISSAAMASRSALWADSAPSGHRGFPQLLGSSRPGPCTLDGDGGAGLLEHPVDVSR